MAKDASKVADKWAQKLAGSVDQIRDGVNAVTEAPGIAAARNADGWIAGIMNNKDKWKRNVAAVPVDEWKRKTLDLGLNRIAAGANANKPKMERFMTAFLPFQETVTNKVRAMPKTDLESGIARMIEQVRGTAKFPGVNR